MAINNGCFRQESFTQSFTRRVKVVKARIQTKKKFLAALTRFVIPSLSMLGLFACGSLAGGGGKDKIGSMPFPDEYAGKMDSDHLTLALKVVSYKDTAGTPVINKDQVKKVVSDMNHLYTSCNLHFRTEVYDVVSPAEHGLNYNTQSMSELDKIRQPFDDSRFIVVTNTGAWNHGSMGVANAWTAMPGESPMGAVLESAVATFSGIVAHEVGHYLNLDHVSDNSNLMNPVIYDSSTVLTKSQCTIARDTAMGMLGAVVRPNQA